MPLFQWRPLVFHWPRRIPRYGPGIYLSSWQLCACLFGWRAIATWREQFRFEVKR